MEEARWAIATVVLSVALSLAGMLGVRRSIALSTLEQHSEVAGFVYAVLGVVYAVLMAFVVTVGWDRFARAETVVEQEANALVDLSLLAESLPEADRAQIRQALVAYARVVMQEEWDLMAKRAASPTAFEQLERIWGAYRRIEPRTNQESAAYQQSLQQLDDLSDARGNRLLLARTGFPLLLWAVLIVGAQVTIAFSLLFGVKNVYAQTVIVATLATTVALVLFLISALDYPFDGLVRVHPRALELALAAIERAPGTTPGR